MSDNNSRMKEFVREYRLDKAADVINEEINTPNRIDEMVFQKYLVLFNKPTKENDTKLLELADEYFNKVDPYKETEIVSSTGKVILTLPPTFHAYKPLRKEDANLVEANVSMALANTHESHKAQAFHALMEALNKNQLSKDNLISITKARKRFIELSKSIKAGDTSTAIAEEESDTMDDDLFGGFEEDA